MNGERKGLARGLVQVYTGDGKGKTTAALGQAMRAAGQGLRVIVIQFVKGLDDCGEHFFAVRHPAFQIIQPAKGDAFAKSKDQKTAEAKDTYGYAQRAMASGDYDMVVLDEILVAVREGFLTSGQVLDLIAAKPVNMELVLTGRGATPEIVKAADLVTEMLMIKHPFAEGVGQRCGIEY